QLVGDEAGLGDQAPAGLDGPALPEQPGAGRQGDPDVRLGGLALQGGGGRVRGRASTLLPSGSSLVRAARATRTCDWVVSTCRSTVSLSTSAWSSTARCRRFRAAERVHTAVTT